MCDLSTDAQIMLSTIFCWGLKSSIRIGGDGAENILSDRAEAAMKELIDAGYVTAEPYNRFGRMTYTGTEKVETFKRLPQGEIKKHGAGFRLTQPANAHSAPQS